MNDTMHVDGWVSRPPQYHSYLLRFWQERGETEAANIWRFMLQDPHTSERFGFADLETLVYWIRERMTLDSDASSAQE